MKGDDIMGSSYRWHTCKMCGKQFYGAYLKVYCSDECKASTRTNRDGIIKFYDQHCDDGMTYKEMAKEFGCNVTTFEQICLSAGKEKPLTKQQHDIKVLYKNGNTISEIASALSLENKNVRRSLKRIGLYGCFKPDTLKCALCGNEFVQKSANQIYCSVSCQKRASHEKNDVFRRMRSRSAKDDTDITLKKVFERDGGRCWICGLVCNFDDYVVIDGKRYAKKMYPSVDHVLPISKGGRHCWENVRLAHFGCNASKGAKIYA